MKTVIVGGVAGGASAAARLRRLDEKAEIVVFERSGFVSYANCGLPYYIGDVITDPEELTLQTPESFFARFRIDVRVNHEVTAIHREQKTVLVRNTKTGEEFEESYDKLVLAPGAKPVLPPIPGTELENVFTLRTVEDTLRIKDYLGAKKPNSALLVGGGFIGLELAENLKGLGMDVTVVERADQVMAPFDADMAALLHTELRRNGVRLLLGRSVEGLEQTETGIRVRLDGGEEKTVDTVILAVGVVPDASLAERAGLALGKRGSIAVNDRMQTSDPDIYAAGDAVQVTEFVTGETALISLAGPANKQGRIVADNICGIESRYRGSQASSIVKLFGLTAATTGIGEKTAKAHGIEAESVVLSPMSHAGYYPNGTLMTVKVIFEKKTFHLLGAQIIGREGVDKRIDVLATALRAGMNAVDLKDLDLAYAPPFSSAKDPVNMAGFMIENIKLGILRQWHLEQADTLPRDGSVTLLDVRTKGEFATGHIDGFYNLPVDELREHLDRIDPNKDVYVICQSGLRSYIACRILEGNGYRAFNFAGGFRFYDAVNREKQTATRATACGKDD